MSGRITSVLQRAPGAGQPMAVELEARVDTLSFDVRLEIRAPARRAQRSLTLVLYPSAAKELMRALQAATDRADRLAYQADKALQEVAP